MTTRSRLASLAASAVLLTSLTACDAAADKVRGPDPQETADALATGLAGGDLSGLTFTDGTDGTDGTDTGAAYAAIVEGMGDLSPAVTATSVSQSGSDATATLTWTWPLTGGEWTYDTEVSLTEADDDYTVGWSPSLVEPSLGADETLDVTTVAAERGPITGAGGRTIVTERPVVRYGIDRPQVPAARAGASARRLARLVGIDAAPYVRAVEAAGDQAFVEAIAYRRGEVPPPVGRDYRSIPGAATYGATLPLAPTRGFAGPILGTVGPVTEEMVTEDPQTYRVGDVAGLSGLQARYDEQLRGTPGTVVDAVAPDGTERELHRVEATPGTPLALSLDVDLQTEAEGLLADVAPASALVALRPSTGEILAAANGPGTDGYNMATFGQFAPGSTFKSVSSLALLRAGLTPDSAVPCTASVTVDGKRFENYDDYPASGLGRIPLRSALADSCNTAFISQADRLSGTDLYDAAASLGLGIDHDLGFPAYFGSVPTPESETEAAADLIGQGRILASPMVMAAVIGSVQSGSLVVPRLVDGVEVSAPEGAAPLTRAETRALRSMLRGVVTGGSGAALADLPGPPAIAKTGTAEFGPAGDVRLHAWMIAAQGDLAVAVFVDEGESGSRTAGPILESFLRASR